MVLGIHSPRVPLADVLIGGSDRPLRPVLLLLAFVGDFEKVVGSGVHRIPLPLWISLNGGCSE
jgi:hypothetical protein